MVRLSDSPSNTERNLTNCWAGLGSVRLLWILCCLTFETLKRIRTIIGGVNYWSSEQCSHWPDCLQPGVSDNVYYISTRSVYIHSHLTCGLRYVSSTQSETTELRAEDRGAFTVQTSLLPCCEGRVLARLLTIICCPAQY